MTILEIMERANTRDTKLVTAFIKDAIMKVQSTTDMSTKVSKQNIVVSSDGDDNQYDLYNNANSSGSKTEVVRASRYKFTV